MSALVAIFGALTDIGYVAKELGWTFWRTIIVLGASWFLVWLAF